LKYVSLAGRDLLRLGKLEPFAIRSGSASRTYKTRRERKMLMTRSRLRLSVVIGSVMLAIPFGFACRADAADSAGTAKASQQWLSLSGKSGPGKEGPGKGRRIVLIAGANEYNPEIGLPILARILAARHGFDCTVLFTVNKTTGAIDPNVVDNIPGLEALDQADLLVICARFRTLPDEQMKHVVDYLESGRPVIGLRTATHSFAYPGNSRSKYEKYRWDNHDAAFDGGFGRQVLGETWITHHAPNGATSTRGVIAPGAADSPILRGIADREIWGSTGVYGVRLPLLPNCQPLLLGEVIEGGKPSGKPVTGKLNDPMMPIAWTRTYSLAAGKTGRVFTTTMGSAADIENAAFRRLLVNACYWALGMDEKIRAKADVDLVRVPQYHSGIKPAELQRDP
jgi:type 1 glutamine amidotransferase